MSGRGAALHLVRWRRHAPLATLTRGIPQAVHHLTGPQSLFQETCSRLSGGGFGKLSVLSNYQHRFLIQEQLQEIGLSADIALEPCGQKRSRRLYRLADGCP